MVDERAVRRAYPKRVSALALYGSYPSKDGGLGFATTEYAERWRSRAEAMLECRSENRSALLRRIGFRTAGEICEERCGLKMLEGAYRSFGDPAPAQWSVMTVSAHEGVEA